jgi:SAM-dependent methyltransferase
MESFDTRELATAADPRRKLMARVAEILQCVECQIPFARVTMDLQETLRCPRCERVIDPRVGQFQFGEIQPEVRDSDWLNRKKERAKRLLGGVYPLAIRVLSPVHVTRQQSRFLKTFDTNTQMVVDLGSGTSHYKESVVCVDGVSHANVHVTANLESLPFQDNSVDGIVSIAVLEHVPDPQRHVQEMKRILRPGGRLLCHIPFMQGYHASPDDFQRYTISGIRYLFRDFEIISTGVSAGPTSGMLWILQEWLALLFSFGSRRLYRVLMPLMWFLSPLKYVDVLLAHHPNAAVIASALFIEARHSDETP